jgi:hypothetical protein
MGAPPGQYGAPQPGYGAPPPGAMMQAGPPGAMAGYGAAPMGAAGPKGKVRNPVMVLLLGMVCFIYAFIQLWGMMNELKAYLGKEEIQAWHLLIPVWGMIVYIFKVPGWVTEAKQKAGCQNPQAAPWFLYWLLGLYFFPKDLNDVWQAGSPQLQQ